MFICFKLKNSFHLMFPKIGHCDSTKDFEVGSNFALKLIFNALLKFQFINGL